MDRALVKLEKPFSDNVTDEVFLAIETDSALRTDYDALLRGGSAAAREDSGEEGPRRSG